MMQLIIDIPNKIYNYIKRLDWPELEKEEQKKLPIAVVCRAVKEGMPTMLYPQVEGITPTVVAPYTDCVSRQYLAEKAVSWDKHFANGIRYVALTDILNAPSANPRDQKTGHWIYDDECHEHGHCSKCGAKEDLVDGKIYNYRRVCGTKMEDDMSREEAWNRIDAIIARHEIDDEYVTITSLIDYDALRMARKALKQEAKIEILDEIKKIVAEWEEDTWTDGLSYECMVKIAGLVRE